MAQYIEEIAQRVSTKVGVDPKFLDADTIRAMWLGCRSEVTTFDKKDGWCTVFSQRDVEILEFGDEMIAYYVKGHGHPLSKQCSQQLFVDIVRHMDDVNDNKGVEPGYLRFAHAETLLPIISLMGLYEEEKHLEPEWSYEEILSRKWRVSEISPMAGSVAFAQYKCGDNEERYVEFLHNEFVKTIPGCNGIERLCPLNQFKNIYKNILEMDWDKVCKDD